MLEEESKTVDNPQITREQMVRQNISGAQTTKKSKSWIFKLILILIIIGFVLYLFKNTDAIRNFVNRFFGNLLS